MSKILAIRGDKERGNEVIALLEMLGGKNHVYDGTDEYHIYFIDNEGMISTLLYNDCCHTHLTYQTFTLDEFHKKYPYKVGDIVKTVNNEEGVIKEIGWVNIDIVYWVSLRKNYDWVETLSVDVLDKYNRLNSNDEVKENNMGSCKCPEYEDVKKVEYLFINDKDYADEIEVNLGDDYEYKFEMNRLYILKKKPKYPKTYKECFYTLYGHKNDAFNLNGVTDEEYDLISNFIILTRCRDAYWKIAGEQMGLGDSWKYDMSKDEFSYAISYQYGWLEKNEIRHKNAILTFPTKEMRDSFYENFKKDIEQCKELL
jgi:hypothetical protein